MPLASIADLNRPIEEVTEHIEVAKQLSDLYDDYILIDQDGHDRAPGIHASELYPCLRKPFYSLTRVERKPQVPKFWKQRFKVGKAIHEMVQNDFHEMAKRSARNEAMRVSQQLADRFDFIFEFEDEVKVAPHLQPLAALYDLHSAADGIFTFRKRATREIALRIGLEIKSAAPDGYEKLKEPKPEHVRQGHLYMACLDLPLMWFFYMNKGNQNNTKSQGPFLAVWQPRIWAELEDRFKIIIDHAERGELPERTETVVCEFCPWRYTCQPTNMMRSSARPPSRKELIRKPGA